MVTIDRINSDYTIYYDEQAQLYRAMCNKCGGTSYSNSDAATVIQNAIDALTNGGSIFIRAGTYTLSDRITLKAKMTLMGEGRSTILKMSDNVNKTILYIPYNEQYVTIKDLRLDGNKDNNTSGHGIHFYHSEWAVARAWIYRVEIWNTAEHGLFLDKYAAIYVNGLRVFYADKNGVFVDSDDNLLTDIAVGCSKWTNIAIDGRHNHLTSFHIWTGGYTYAGTDNSKKAGLLITGDQNTVSNGETETNRRFGVFIYQADRNVISNVLCWSNGIDNSSNTGRGISVSDSLYNIISLCVCFDYRDPAYQVNGIYEYGTADYNLIIGNDVSLGHTGTPIVIVGSHTTCRHNKGHVTENSGTATISNGTSSETVTHGLASTPTKIVVTGKHSEVANLYVDTIGSTQFTIHVKDGNVTADREVLWQVEI